MKLYRKDKYRKRKYFDSFPLKYDQAFVLGHYFCAAYGWFGIAFDNRWFDLLNQLIYRVSTQLRIPPSKIIAEQLVMWIVARHKRK